MTCYLWCNNLAHDCINIVGPQETAPRGESSVFSHVGPAIPLTTAGAATPIGKSIGRDSPTVASGSGGTPSVGVMAGFTSSPTPATMMPSTRDPALYAMLSSKTSLYGLSSKETWLLHWSKNWSWTALRPSMLVGPIFTLPTERA